MLIHSSEAVRACAKDCVERNWIRITLEQQQHYCYLHKVILYLSKLHPLQSRAWTGHAEVIHFECRTSNFQGSDAAPHEALLVTCNAFTSSFTCSPVWKTSHHLYVVRFIVDDAVLGEPAACHPSPIMSPRQARFICMEFSVPSLASGCTSVP